MDLSFAAADFAIFALLAVSAILILIGYYQHGSDILNPITAFVIMELILTGVISAASSLYGINVFNVPSDRLAAAVWIHLIYGICVVAGYFLSPLYLPIAKLLHSLSKVSVVPSSGSAVRTTLILCALISMSMLIMSGPEGLSWLTNTRYAYISLRSGFGQWWVLYQISIVLLFIKSLFEDRNKSTPRSILKKLLLYSGLMYFTGSKSAVLIICIIAAIHFHLNVRRLNLFGMLGILFLVLIVFNLLLGDGNLTDPAVGFFRYFVDYIAVSAINIQQVDIQGFAHGQATLSTLWYWIPRSLVADKPFEWGTTYLNNVLFPGMAEKGHTPGVLLWITYYIDFGLAGVFAYGIFLGSFSRAVYLKFLRSRDVGSFMLMIPFCFFIVPVSAGSSYLFIAMALFLWLFDSKASLEKS
jgi:hypothetical protein